MIFSVRVLRSTLFIWSTCTPRGQYQKSKSTFHPICLAPLSQPLNVKKPLKFPWRFSHGKDGIFTDTWMLDLFVGKLVGKYTSPMDPIGLGNFRSRFFLFEWPLPSMLHLSFFAQTQPNNRTNLSVYFRLPKVCLLKLVERNIYICITSTSASHTHK